MMFIVRANGQWRERWPPDAGVRIALMRRTPSMVAESEGQTDLFCVSDEAEMDRFRARGWDSLCLYAWRPHLFNPRLKRWLHRISVPTLVLWGESDQIVTPSYGRAYADLILGSRFEQIADAGHHPELEQPAAFVEAVVRFLKG